MRIGMAFGDIGGDGGRELALFSFKMSALLFFKSYMKSSLLLGFSTILYLSFKVGFGYFKIV